MDEMWGRAYCKKTPCWLWHAIDHDNGEIVAYVFGTHKSEVLGELWALLKGMGWILWMCFLMIILLIMRLYREIFCIQINGIRSVLSVSI